MIFPVKAPLDSLLANIAADQIKLDHDSIDLIDFWFFDRDQIDPAYFSLCNGWKSRDGESNMFMKSSRRAVLLCNRP